MEWLTYKGIFTFYHQANSITDAALKKATLLTLIGDIAYCMLANLHLPADLSTVNFDTYRGPGQCLRQESIKTGTSRTIPVYRPTQGSISL